MSNIEHLRETIGSRGGWKKYAGNPVMGGNEDFRFDNHVLRTESGYRMYFSWRKYYAIAMVESSDGINWSEPVLVLRPRPETGWEDDVNRPTVVHRDGKYHMWYSGQTAGKEFSSSDWGEIYLEASANELGKSAIGYATSIDGISWERRDLPVLEAEAPWEKQSLMCPSATWDAENNQYRMWYSGGGWFEPDAIGHATSVDGVNWTRSQSDPVFEANPNHLWEAARVAGPQAIRIDDWWYLFYIGYEDMFKARIGVARSQNGVSDWERLPANPILSAGVPGGWDCESIYKPFVVFDEDSELWTMWFNARTGTTERIGVAYHEGKDLGFV